MSLSKLYQGLPRHRVDYSLTPLGLEVAKMAYQLKDWAESNIEQVIYAQQRFDAIQQEETK